MPLKKGGNGGKKKEPRLDTLQRGVQWMGGAVDWGSII